MPLTSNEIDLANYIEHSLLHPAATSEQLNALCNAAIEYSFPTVCVSPHYVKAAVEILHNQSVEVCTVISFPSGATTSKVKLYEAQEAMENGATALDIVINLGWLKEGKTEKIYQEIAQIREATGVTLKAILETGLLTQTEKQLAAEVCMDAGVDYIKTSTGWFGGATVEDVKFLHNITKGRVKIKASGGIQTAQQALELIIAGASRLGTSRGVDLIMQRNSISE